MVAFFDSSSGLPKGLEQLFERSNVSLTIADATLPDSPLIGANSAFLDLCGYGVEDVLGHNCRFLQPEGGAGPVRARMRRFLQQEDSTDARFLIPNRTRGGEDFLNLVYMAKLESGDGRKLVLGSQFRIDSRLGFPPDLYDRALKEDLRKLSTLTKDDNWVFFGSLETLATSHSIIARTRLD